tara:strand:+ start:638 stop:940 length:303 start_codon:yes stop_codon:yes gene_type:complete
LCLNDIFVLDEIFLKESIQIMNLKVEDIVKDINIELLNNKILLNNMSNADYEDLTMKQIDNQNIYREILEELDKYKKNNTNKMNCYIDIPLNEWGKWIYI